MTKSPIERTEHICVMGVSGVGKTTVGEGLASRLGRTFGDADDLHSRAAVEKMASGTPLTDADRDPWLDAVVGWLDESSGGGTGVVFACSALRRAYREHLVRADKPVFFVHLTAEADELRRRMTERTGHFMHVNMLQSQLDTLEPIGDDEHGIEVPTAGTVEATIDAVVAALGG